MIDYCSSLGSSSAIISHKQIALNDFYSLSIGAEVGESLNPCRINRRPDEATHSTEAAFEQLPHNTLPYETGSTGYQDEVIRSDYVSTPSHPYSLYLYSVMYGCLSGLIPTK